jgi:3-dehydroquinate dehydratase II
MQLRSPDARKWTFGFIDGPNMGMLGRREGAIFGPVSSLEQLNKLTDDFAAEIGVGLVHFQSDAEPEILHFIHETSTSVDGYLINPAGLTYFGQATRDALIDTSRPYLEVHFANLSVWKENTAPGRDLQSMFSHTATGIFEGMRHYGYFAGILALALALDDESFLGQTTRQSTDQD